MNVGKENAEFQHLEVLKRNRTKRKQHGRVFVEGVACINALMMAGWKVFSIAYDREKPLSRWAQDVIVRAKPEKVLRLTTSLMEKLSDRDDPSELIVTAERKESRLSDLDFDEHSVFVIFDRPSNHGNLGSLIRSCDALGVSALIMLGHTVDVFDPAVMRASLGAFFTLPVVHCQSPSEIDTWIAEARSKIPKLRLIGTSAKAEKLVHQADLGGPLVLILGNEAGGLSRKLAELVDESVAIPMLGSVSSLNVACAGTVLLYEVSRQNAMNGLGRS